MSERELEKENTVVWKDRKHFLWFPWSFVKYSIENGRLIIRSGLFNSTVEETLLYRIVDISMKQTLWGKLFGTGDIIVKAKVDSTPEITLKNISHPDDVRRILLIGLIEFPYSYWKMAKCSQSTGRMNTPNSIAN